MFFFFFKWQEKFLFFTAFPLHLQHGFFPLFFPFVVFPFVPLVFTFFYHFFPICYFFTDTVCTFEGYKKITQMPCVFWAWGFAMVLWTICGRIFKTKICLQLIWIVKKHTHIPSEATPPRVGWWGDRGRWGLGEPGNLLNEDFLINSDNSPHQGECLEGPLPYHK